MKKCLFTILFAISLACNLFANNAWEAVVKNDYPAAKSSFLKELKKDSTSFDALVGLIYIAEVEKDNLSYFKYVSLLSKYHPTNEVYFAFNDKEFDKSHKNDDIQTLLNIKQAQLLFDQRKFTEADAIIKTVKSDLNWEIIGPYENISGSGYMVDYQPEKNKDADKYDDLYVFQQAWTAIENIHPLGAVKFSAYLPYQGQYSTYYARSAFNLKSNQELVFNLTRTSPIKIWLDNELIFESDVNAKSVYDFERIKVSLNEGNHTLFIKVAPLFESKSGNSILGVNKYYTYNFFNLSDFTSYNTNYFESSFDFLVRLTDLNYDKVNVESSPYQKANQQEKPAVSLSKLNIIESVKEKINTIDNPYPYYYLLSYLYSSFRDYTGGEEYFYYLNKKEENVFSKYLLAKFYENNKKGNKIYQLLDEVDHSKTPIFGLLQEKFETLDADADEKLYLEKLDQLNKISPSNRKVIDAYLDYYISKGKQEEKKAYLEKIIERYPSYKDVYEAYLEDENYKPEIYKSKSDEEKKKDFMEAKEALDTSFSASYYNSLITYYKNNDMEDSVVFCYDELIKHLPYSFNNYYSKANYLYGLEKHEEAIATLQEVLNLCPHYEDAITMLADINFDKKNSDAAASNYKKAMSLYALGDSYYKEKTILEKLRKIEPEEDYTEYFLGKSIAEILKENDYKNQYEEEDAFIVYSSQDVVIKKYNKADIIFKEVIKINTEAGSRDNTELDYSHFGKLTTVKVIKNNTEIIPDYRNNYIVIKNLEPGDLIVIEGISKDNSLVLNSIQYSLNTYFYVADYKPIYYKRVNVVLPKDYNLNYSYYNMDNLKKEPVTVSKKDKKIDFWEFNKVPKYVYEDGSLYDWEVLGFIATSDIESWDVISKWYLKTTYKSLDFTYDLKEVLDSLKVYEMKPKDQVITLYNYITEHIDYSNVSFLQSNFKPKKPDLTNNDKIGDCKDVAALMLTFLKELGIESYFTLVRTLDYSLVNFPPGITFDHAIVCYKLGDTFEYLDLTSDYYPWFVTSSMDMGAYALRINEQKNEIFSLPMDGFNRNKNLIKYVTDAKLVNNEDMLLTTKATYFGMSGGTVKSSLSNTDKEEQERLLTDLLYNPSLSDMKLVSFDLSDLNEITDSMNANYTISAYSVVDEISDLLIFKMPFLNPLEQITALQKENRQYSFYPEFIIKTDPQTELVSIEIPENYELTKLPKEQMLENKFFDYNLNFELVGNTVKIERNLTYKMREIRPEDFSTFKEEYQKAFKLDNKKMYVVLKEG